MFLCCALTPTWHGVDQVAAQHHESRPGSELVNGLHGLLSELHFLSPFFPPAVTVAVPPGLHKPKLGVCSLDEEKWPSPFVLCV